MGSDENDPFRQLEEELRGLEAADLRRFPSTQRIDPRLNFASNDYLGFGAEQISVTARGGASASPIVSGNFEVHEAAARALGDWVGRETATLFSSTFAANVGLLQAVGGPRTLVLSDALNHASIIDGCRLSRSHVRVVPHLDLDAAEAVLAAESSHYDRAWFISEAYFSMDGDSPNLPALRRLCDRYGAGLILDEAHSLGVFGLEGRGLAAASGIEADVLIGALGKSVGLHGGFIAGRRVVRDLLWNKARSLIFSTGISPLVASAIPERIEAVRRADDRRRVLSERAAKLRSLLGVNAAGYGPIVPWRVGAPAATIGLGRELAAEGFLVGAIRPPTVPQGTSRLRLAVSTSHDEAAIERLAGLLTRSRSPAH